MSARFSQRGDFSRLDAVNSEEGPGTRTLALRKLGT